MKNLLQRFDSIRITIIVGILAAFLSVIVLATVFWVIPIITGVWVAEKFRERYLELKE